MYVFTYVRTKPYIRTYICMYACTYDACMCVCMRMRIMHMRMRIMHMRMRMCVCVHVNACGPKTVLVKLTFLGWGGVGWGGACQRSLYFVHYSVLRCKDLWDRCYVTCFYAADGVGSAMTVKNQKNAPQFFPGFQIITSARHCGKITIFGHNVHAGEHGFRPGGMLMYMLNYTVSCNMYNVCIMYAHAYVYVCVYAWYPCDCARACPLPVYTIFSDDIAWPLGSHKAYVCTRRIYDVVIPINISQECP